jgi:hypothetical protein
MTKHNKKKHGNSRKREDSELTPEQKAFNEKCRLHQAEERRKIRIETYGQI